MVEAGGYCTSDTSTVLQAVFIIELESEVVSSADVEKNKVQIYIFFNFLQISFFFLYAAYTKKRCKICLLLLEVKEVHFRTCVFSLVVFKSVILLLVKLCFFFFFDTVLFPRGHYVNI